MQITAEQKNTRQSPRKVRLVANAVRKLSIQKAMDQLAVMERRASIAVAKVLRQALANAWHNHHLAAEELELKNILVGEGPTYKRFRAVSRGRAHTIFKRSSHIQVILETKQAPAAKAEVKTEAVKEEKKTEKAAPKAAKKTTAPKAVAKKVVKKAKK
ncbi:MAG: 50S ribosomal protein L22 [Candidatus Pacebacteria bacterium CG10_big_fil_rev_8_21_14_0_10_36_11]|nr:50S ribosomal protein L22 [Candidatus Pacearchaeota archaeon]OIP73698.1 MAG: 50S ribosomal protein L22 [Candidatus Pacebacteria bacterium CG2_30_36_39]PIR64717.1 MAG: 50S ribosomal protein L22 [Candidatus Pacebacteria bacterium CG10_big_fil_rev_8_21_14_0_10_36_11]PJC42340.1 MAG: 50S ribosomal protein L22 [Candidatus Pacebacteria bacterium CG_4_9_14_0_2_um_filter_36_8]